MNRYALVQIEDLERAQGPELVSRVVSGFRCPKNAEVETFLHRQALPFTRKHVSITYLVFGGAAPDLVGYFSLTHKPLAIPGVDWSVFLREDTEYIKVSCRSVGDFSVNDICAKYFNGGGHVNAAGGEFYGTLQQAVETFEQLLVELFPDASSDNVTTSSNNS